MALLSELRYPTTRLAKIFSGLLALILFGFVAISTVSGFLLYQMIRPARTPTAFDLTIMMGHPTTLAFPLEDGSTRDGWFFPGLRGAPTVIVAHGYREQRADVLTLVTALQEQQFNAFLFDFTGHGTSQGVTTLGYKEAQELRSAVQTLSTRDDLDPRRFGLWGVDMGGYAALEVATSDPRIAALAVDDAYGDPRDMVQLEVSRSGLTALPGVSAFSDVGFRLLNFSFRQEPPVTTRLARTVSMPKLFIASEDRPSLANSTVRLFNDAPEPKQLLRYRQNYSDMSDEDRKNYESQMVNFYLQAMPPSGRPSH
jgi:pimeloyl-ACP methyl ester carboxylesterase